MNSLIKIALIAFVYLILASVLKNQRAEYVFLIRISAVIIIFFVIADSISDFLTDVMSAFSVFNISSSHISTLLKVVGITIVSDFVCDNLKDNGESSLAGVVSIASKFTILYMSLPFINGLIIFCVQLVS